MACCGQRRAQLTQQAAHMAGAGRAPRTPVASSRYAVYEYTGGAQMTVTAGVSGTRYRFAAPGATAQVDPRDVAAISALPHLRRIG